MPELGAAFDRFQSLLRVDGSGRAFYGVISIPPEDQQPSYQFTAPRRVLRTRGKALVQIRDVIIAPSGERFLVAENGTADLASTSLYTSYRLYVVDSKLTWKRPTLTTDTVTQMAKETARQDRGQIWCAVEPMNEDLDRQTYVRQERIRILTGAALQLNDYVGDRVVKRVNTQLGVIIAEVQ